MAYINANWAPGTDTTGETFEVLVVTEDEQRHSVSVTPAGAAGFFAMVRASPVLLFDVENQTVIAANIVGEWLPSDWTAMEPTT